MNKHKRQVRGLRRGCHSSYTLSLVNGLDPDENLFQEAFKEHTHIAAHPYWLGLVIVVDLLTHMSKFINQMPDSLVRRLGTLLVGRGRCTLCGSADTLDTNLPPLEGLFEGWEDDVVQGIQIAIGI